MSRYKSILFSIILTITLFISGCSALNPDLNFDLDAESLRETAVAFVQATASVPPTPIPLQTYQATITRRPTTTPTPTVTPTPSNTPTNTSTPGVHAMMAGDVNCRTGPSNHYDWVSLATTGTSVTLLGRNRENSYWYIQNPEGNGGCWIWNYFSTPEGQTAQLPVFTSPPTKTPTKTPRDTPRPSFSIKFQGVIDCGGQESIIVRVYNSTPRPFIFWRAQVFNVPGGVRQTEISSSQFAHKVDECTQTIGTLAYRQTAYAVIPFDINQAGEFLVEFEACSDETEVRDCAFDGFKFDTLSLTPTATPTETSTPSTAP